MSSAPLTGKPPTPAAETTVVEYHEYVDAQVKKTARAVRAVDISHSVLRLVAVATLSLLVLALVEHWGVRGGLGSWGRYGAFLLLLAGFVFWLTRDLWPLVRRGINPVYAASTIEQASPSLKNSLVNLLMFRTGDAPLPRPVYETIERQAAERLVGASIEDAVDGRGLIRWGYILVATLALGATYAILSPKNPFASAARVLMPWSEIAAPTRVRIDDVLPGTAEAVRGEPVAAGAIVSGLNEDEQPMLVVLGGGALGGKEVSRLPMTEADGIDQFATKWTPIADPSEPVQVVKYRIEAGDARSPVYRLTLVTAPAITVREVRYDYPDYTGYLDRTAEGAGDLRAIEGTRVTVYSEANMPIDSAQVDFQGDGRPDLRMTVDDRRAEAAFDLALRDDRRTPRHSSYVLRFTSTDDRANTHPASYRIEVLPDLPPEASLLAPEEEVRDVRLNETVAVRVEARDPDFALASVRVQGAIRGDEVFSARLLSDRHEGKFDGLWRFTPAEHGLKAGDVVDYWVVATDVRTPVALTGESRRQKFRITSPGRAEANPNEGVAEQQGGEGGQGQRRQDGGEGEPQGGEQDQQGGDGASQDQGEGGAGGESQSEAGEQNGEGQQSGQSGEAGQQEQSEGEGQQQSPEGGLPSNEAGAEGGEGQSGAGQQSPDGGSGEAQQQGGDSPSGERSGDASNQQGADQQDGQGGQEGADQQSGQQSGQQQNGQQGGEGQGGGDDQQPVSADGDDDANAMQRIREHLKQQEGQQEGQQQEGQQKEGQSGEGQQGGDSQQQQNEGQQQGDAGAEQERSSQGQSSDQQGRDTARTSADEQPSRDPGQSPNAPQDPTNDRKQSDQSTSSEAGEQNSGEDSAENSRKPREGTGGSGKNQAADEGNGVAGDQGPGEDGQRGGNQRESDGQQGDPSGEQRPGEGQRRREGQGDKPGGEQRQGDPSGQGQDGAGESESGEGSPQEGQPESPQGGQGQQEQPGGEQGAGDQQGDRRQPGESNQSSDPAGREAGEGQQQGDQSQGEQSQGDQSQANPQQPPGERPGAEGQRAGDNQDSGQQPGRPGSPESETNAQPDGGLGSGAGEHQGGDPGGDEANLEYAREQTDLVLKKLSDQLAEKKVDRELLDELGWSEEDLRRFVARWQARKQAAQQRGGESQRELDDALRSLGLDAPDLGGASASRDDNLRDVTGGRRSTVPAKLRERLRRYNAALSTGE